MYPLTVAIVIGTRQLSEEARPVLQSLGCRVALDQVEVNDWPEFVGTLERVHPDVVLYDIANSRTGMEEAIRLIRSAHNSPAIFVMDTSATPEKVLRAIHLGAAEFLYPPLTASLKEALQRVADEAKRQNDQQGRGRVAGFVSAKGGCGATTIAAHTALEIPSLTGEKVLLADLDLESGLVSFLMGISTPYSVLDVVENLDRLDANFWKGLISEGRPGVDVLSSVQMPNLRPAPNPDQMHDLIRFLRGQYGAVIFDLGRSVTPMLLATYEHVDSLFVVATLEVPALHRAEQIVTTMLNRGLPKDRLQVILNRMPRDPDVTIPELEKMMGTPIFTTVPSDYPALNECYSEGKFLPASNRLSRRIADVAAYVMGVAPQKKNFSLLA